MTDRLLRIDRVEDKVGLSRSTIWRLRRNGDFPEAVPIHGSCIAWSEAELDEWIQRRKGRRVPAFSFR
jgi:prophage regulatory protein